MKAGTYVSTLLAATLLLTAAGPVQGQIDDARWLPFVGCWEADGDAEAGFLCFQPAQGGVEMNSIVAGEIVATERLAADGQPRPIVAEGCEGTESVTFSEDGRRAFTRSEFTCGDDDRAGTGVMAMVTPTRWVDVRALEIRGETVSWVQAYTLVDPDRLVDEGVSDPVVGLEGTVRATRVIAARDIDLDDVTEAVTSIDPEAVVAWVAAQRSAFEVDGDELVRLADSGVPESVIDVVVAVSFPERFVVAPEQAITPVAEEPFQGRRIPVRVGYRSYMAFDPFYYDSFYGFGYSPFRYSPFRYSPFGYSPFGYSPWGYGLGGYYPYGYGPTVVRVERRRPSGGRVVSGRGWTRGSGVDTGRMARPSGAGAGSRAWSGGGGSSSRGAWSRGAGSSSRGSARPSGRRKAKPRGGR